MEDPRCGEGGAAAASRPARAEAVTPLHHRPPPLTRALLSHPPASLSRLGSSPAVALRLFPGAFGPFRHAIGKGAGGSSAPLARPALAPAPRAAPRRFPRARARPPPERAWPPIKEARRARRRHYPLRSERRGGRPRRRVGPSATPPPPQPGAPTDLTPQEPVRGGAGEFGEGAGPEGRRPLGGEPRNPWGGAGPARGQVSPACLAAPSDGRGPGGRAAARRWSVGCGGAARPSLGAGRWNVIDWAEGGRRGRRVRPAPPPPSLAAAPPCPIRLRQVGQGPLAGSSPSPFLRSAPPAPLVPCLGEERLLQLLFPSPHSSTGPTLEGGRAESLEERAL